MKKIFLKNDEFDEFIMEPPETLRRKVLGARGRARKRKTLLTAAFVGLLLFFCLYKVETSALSHVSEPSYYACVLGEEVMFLGEK